jgi:hypothetical protein
MAVGRHALRDLAFVVGELQVHATAVDVERADPRYLVLIALHSKCQPGKPSPQGLGHFIR